MVCIDDEIPFEIPNGWRWARLGWVFELRSGQDFPPEKYNDKSIGTPYITGASNIDGNVIIQNRWTEYPSVIAPEGCLLLVCKGSGIGKMCYMNIPKAHIARQIQAIIPFTTNIIIDFLRFAIECRLIEITSQANGVIPGISREATLSFLLPIPPLKEQIRIVEKLKRIEPLVSQYGICESKLKHINSDILSSFRKSILQEAIKGSLVKQDPNDEPAFVLLQRIKEEKLRLVKEGKLKKKDVIDNNIFRGDDNKYFEKKGKDTLCIDEEIPFEIPNTWEWVRLSDVVQVNPKNDAPDNTLAAFIPMERIDATYLTSFTYSERKWGDIKAGFTHFADGDVAFAKITPCFQNRKSMILKGLPNGIGAGTTELKVLRPYADTIDREYLLFFLESSYFVEEATFKGTANQQRIISGYMENKLFPLPPLSEQHRISEKIKESYKRIGLVASIMSRSMEIPYK